MAHEPKATDELIKAPPSAHRRSDPIAKAQFVLPVFALLGVVGFALSEWFLRGEARFSPGPLAMAHAQWDNQCAACHESSRPLSAHNWVAELTGQEHVADAKCQSCHAGPPHHANQKADEVLGCTACHHDHAGATGRLLAVEDSLCTTCHQKLADHFVPVKTGQGPAYLNVSEFNTHEHPEFAVLRDKQKDPGTISFNHARHLIPGMGTDPAKKGPFTLAQLAPKDREIYRKPEQTSDDALVNLDCRSCHRPEVGDFPLSKDQLTGLPASAIRPPRGAGATMAPIVYEQHCQACHPLTIDRKLPGDAKSDFLAIRHRQQPKEILETLQGHYMNLFLKGQWLPQSVGPTAVLPGKPAAKQKVAAEVDAQAEAAGLSLLLAHHQKGLEVKVLGQTTCQKCHATLDPAKGMDQAVPPANIPTVWFPHARFDHTSHRAVECRDCHAAAYPGADGSSTKSQDVMIPGIKVCAECHAPAHGAGAFRACGVRHTCITCHTYHHGDNPLQDRGSRARQPDAMRSIADFLSGK